MRASTPNPQFEFFSKITEIFFKLIEASRTFTTKEVSLEKKTEKSLKKI